MSSMTKVADCEKCGRPLHRGDEAYESEWKKITVEGGETKVKLEKRYSCYPKCPRES